MQHRYYKLVGRNVVPVLSAAEAFNCERRVALTEIESVHVSTVFLGLNHARDDGPPMLFETMVFDGPLSDEQDRCSTYDEAEAMHERMCERVRQSIAEDDAEARG